MKKKGNHKRQKTLETSKDIALDFAGRVYNKFRDVVKAISMFGSTAKMQINSKSDIDIIIIIDDCTVNWDDELIAWYREELAKLVAEKNYGRELHVNTVTLTTFWEEVRAGEPLVINILRYGEVLIDVGGFFDPLRILLAKGRIRPSPEAIFTTMQRSGQHLGRANSHLLSSVESYYWAVVDASHSALMALKVVPPSPEQISMLLKDNFVDKKLLDKKYLEWYEDIRRTAKDIVHGDKKKLSGSEIDSMREKAESFVKELNNISASLIRNEKIVELNFKK